MVRVGIIEKSPLVLRVLSDLLDQDRRFQVIVSAIDLESFLNQCASPPDMLISGWVGASGGGLEVLRRMAHVYKTRPKVVIFTGAQIEPVAQAAMRAGARAVISKSTLPDQLLDSLWAVAMGRRVHPVHSPTQEIEQLTLRESQVLECLSKGLSNSKISDALEISECTTKFHLRNIFQKLDVQNRTQAVVKFAHQNRGV